MSECGKQWFHLAGMELPQHTDLSDTVQPLNEQQWSDFQARERAFRKSLDSEHCDEKHFERLCKVDPSRNPLEWNFLQELSFYNGESLWTIAWLPTPEILCSSSEKVPGERTNPRGNNTGADYRLDLIAIAVPPRDCAAAVNDMRSRPMEEDGEPKQTVDQQTK